MVDGSSSAAVLADAQFGFVRVLLPYADFEDDYQGQSGSVPIAFPGGRDPKAQANQLGFDPNLQLGHNVPRGSRVDVGIPICENPAAQIQDYRYIFVFRDRNVHDYRTGGNRGNRTPYHYARQGLGAEDTTLAVPQSYFPIDARFHGLGYEQTEPAAGALAILNIYPEAVVPKILVNYLPLVPGGNTAAIQQGIYNPQWVLNAKKANRADFQLDALGDDLIILAQKIPNQGGIFADWDFDNEDVAFSNIYGRGGYAVKLHPVFDDAGIRVTTGSNP